MDNIEPKISIIMPIYNVEKYLSRAVDSILKQTYKDFELFLVDDGSKDKSGLICDEYEKIDKRIKVIHKKNSGAHESRNIAIKMAVGKYLCFFDSDDYIEENMLYNLCELAESSGANLVICGFYIDTYIKNGEYVRFKYIPENEIQYSNKEDFRKDAYKYFDKNMFYSPWNKLYNREYVVSKNILFPNTYRDDFPFVVEVIKDIEKISFTKKCYYHFMREREESETTKYIKNLYEKRLEEHEMMLSLYKYWGLIDDKNSFEMISRRYIDRIVECISNLCDEKCELDKNTKLKTIRSYFDNKYFLESIKYAKPKSLYLRLIYIPLRLKSVYMSFLMCKFIYHVKKKNIKIFSKLKVNR